MMEVIVVFCLGACIGSFLNVCIYRMPIKKSVIFPRSACKCGKVIPIYNNIPILSWLILRGKSACCNTKISVRYLFVEFLTALIFTGIFLTSDSISIFIIRCILSSLLVIATFIDVDTMEIHDSISIGGMFLGLTIAMLLPNFVNGYSGISALDSLIGICMGSGLMVWIAVLGELAFKKEAIGFGDVKLIGTIGSFLGWKGCVLAIFGGCLIVTISALPILAVLKIFRWKDFKMPKELPFVPCLAAGSIAYMLYGDRLLDLFLKL